jgi:hypothetical protein
MQGLFGLLAVAMAASVAFLVAFERGRSRLHAWRKAAEAVGLSGISETSLFGIPTGVEGRADRLVVSIQSYRRGKYERGTRIQVGGLGHGGLVNVSAEGVGSRLAKVFGDQEVGVGDSEFDDVAYVQGDPASVRAVLSADARRALGSLLRGRFSEASGVKDRAVRTTLTDSTLRVEIRARAFDDLGSRLPAILEDLVAAGRLLVRPDDVAARIAENARNEPLDSARLVDLETLATEYPQHQATRSALAAALGDPNPEIQLRAAIALGPDGRDALRRLAVSDDVEEPVVARAIAALEADFPEDVAIDTIRRAVGHDRPRVARACVDRLAANGAARHVEDLAPLAAASDPELAVAAAHALGSATGEAAEAALVGALQSEADRVRLAAAESLGRMGSALAVAPLHACGEVHRFDATLRSAVRQAVATIQSRISGASPGQLSMAADEVGQVSLADTDARGQVSLAATSEASPAERLAAATAGPIPDQAGASQQDDRRRTLEQARRSQLASGQSSRR